MTTDKLRSCSMLWSTYWGQRIRPHSCRWIRPHSCRLLQGLGVSAVWYFPGSGYEEGGAALDEGSGSTSCLELVIGSAGLTLPLEEAWGSSRCWGGRAGNELHLVKWKQVLPSKWPWAGAGPMQWTLLL